MLLLSRTTTRRVLGISLIETVLSMLILAGAFAASLTTIGSARTAQATVAEKRMGLILAEDLMAEILSQPYKEEGVSRLGIDLGERPNDRSTFDDIDDYDAWSASPPQDSAGKPIVGADLYTRSVTVSYTALLSPTTTSDTDQGMKHIVVTVKRGDKTVAELKAFRSDVYDATGGGD